MRTPRTRVNHAIRVPQVRLVDADGSQIGVVPTREALRRAQERGLDLVEVAMNADPPVCRIMDYGKYKYEKEKRDRQARRHQSTSRLKEVKFHANVAEHDYETKIRHAREFIQEGHPVRFSIYFRGREMAHTDLGFALMQRVMNDCRDVGRVDQAPRMIGRNLVMLMAPQSHK